MGGAEDGHAPLDKLIGNALRQRGFGANHGEVNLLFLSYPDQRVNISGFDIQVLGKPGGASITRSGVNIVNLGALGYLPDQGMLPRPTPND